MTLRSLPRARRGRVAAAGLAGAVLATTLAGAPADATIVKPEGSAVTLLAGSTDPVTAPTSGSWGSGVKITPALGTTAGDFGCDPGDQLRQAITYASSDGSTERPVVNTDGSTPERHAFQWTYMAGTTSAPKAPDPSTPEGILVANGGLVISANYFLFPAAGWEAGKTGGIRLRDAGATGGTGLADWAEDLSLVVFCSPGLDATGDPLVSSDESGRAIASWFHFHPGAATVSPSSSTVYPSAGWEYYADAPAPTVAAAASDITRSSATLSATLTDGGGSTYEDATGTIQWYPGDAVMPGDELGDPVTVTAGIAAAKSVDLSGYPGGSAQDFLAVYTPDEASEGHYAGATSEVLTLRVGPDATATTTTLAVTGGLNAGQTQTLAATVAPAAPGTVTFTDGGSTLGTATVSSGVATLQRALAVGAHSVKASFAPADATQFIASASAAQSVTVVRPAAAVTVTAPRATYGRAASVTVSVTAADAPAAGQVAVTLDGRPLASPTLTASGTATVALPATTAAGQHVLAASYAGSDVVSTGTAQQTFTIAKAATKTTVKVVPAKVTAKAAKKGRVKAVVTVAAIGAQPSGTVTVQVGGKKVSAKLSAAGTAKIKLPKSSAKKLKVTATYMGDANLVGSAKSITVKVRR